MRYSINPFLTPGVAINYRSGIVELGAILVSSLEWAYDFKKGGCLVDIFMYIKLSSLIFQETVEYPDKL